MKHIAVDFLRDASVSFVDYKTGNIEPSIIKKDAFVEFDVLYESDVFFIGNCDKVIMIIKKADVLRKDTGRQEFVDFLKKTAAEVEKWPEWKKSCLSTFEYRYKIIPVKDWDNLIKLVLDHRFEGLRFSLPWGEVLDLYDPPTELKLWVNKPIKKWRYSLHGVKLGEDNGDWIKIDPTSVIFGKK